MPVPDAEISLNPHSFNSKKLALAAASILCVLFARGVSFGTEFSDRPLARLNQRFQDKLQELRTKFGFPGATAAFVLEDGRRAATAVGFSDLEENIRMDPQDSLPAGSVGKTFVSALAILLAQENKLNLDDKIEKWLPDRDWLSRLPNARALTIRLLLRHQSGLIEPYRTEEVARKLFAEFMKNPDMELPPEKIISFVLDRPPLFEAGKGYNYSDTNYLIAGLIIERVTHSTYYEELRRRILDPFKLTHTIPQTQQGCPRLVPGYTHPKNPFAFRSTKMVENGRMILNPRFEYTGGGLFSTSEDLASWAKLLYEGRISRRPYLNELLEHDPTISDYGLGVFIWDSGLGPMYGHTGTFPGYLTVMAYFPDHKIAVAAQFNRDYDVGKLTSHAEALARVIVEFDKRSEEKKNEKS